MNLKGESATPTFSYLADDRDYMQILEICRPFYFPSSDVNNIKNNNNNSNNSNPASLQLAPRLDDVLVRVVTPVPHERSENADLPSSSVS